ncbi:MAG: DEAD/DEAH box helicase [Verrucomicrobia bacterium]|nr:DEAD/DEAH box helicase [Verrucomicrobiota bacterium]
MTVEYHFKRDMPSEKFEKLKALGAKTKLLFEGKRVVVDPFTTLELFCEIEPQGEESAYVTGFFRAGNQEGTLASCDFIASGDPPWAIYGGILRAFDERTYSRDLFVQRTLLEGTLLRQFLEREIPLRWKGEVQRFSPDPIPFLQLTDRHGAFADLWFNYGSCGKVAAHDPKTATWRNLSAEKGWENDLLETGFIKKQVDASHYYCPLDKVAKSLSFLLEIGWGLWDFKGRSIQKKRGELVDLNVGAESIQVKGQFDFGAHQIDLKEVAGAFTRREQFVELSETSVGLLDREDFDKEWGEIVLEGFTLKKNRVGILEGWAKELPSREPLLQKLSCWKKEESAEPAPAFQGNLFPYQKEGLAWLQFLVSGGFGGLLADEMGLGKTVQVLALFSHLTPSPEKPILIVAPTSLLFNWRREMEKFLPGQSLYLHGGEERKEDLSGEGLILTSYALLRIDAQLFEKIPFELVVLDEGQTIKNPDSQIAEVCSRLRARTRLVITGTPVENRSLDLWSLFHFLQSDLLGDRKTFQAEMALSQMDGRYLERVRKKIRPFLLRRKKEDLALELPPKLEQTIYVEMTEPQRALYESWLKNTRKKLDLEGGKVERMEILEAILRLRQICAHPWLIPGDYDKDPNAWSGKFERLFLDLSEVVAEGKKVLVYSQFTTFLQLVEKEVQNQGWKSVYLDGSTKDREGVVRAFQEDPEVSIFLISLKAGGVGLNLTAADYVFLYDPWWNEAVEQQAIDRAHRLGKVGTVIARRYISALSVEEKIMHLKTHKRALSQSLLSGEGGFSMDDLISLLI